MGKAAKHKAKLRRKSSGTIFKKRVFRCNQNTPVPKACSSQTPLTNITNRQDSENVLSASARKVQSLNKMTLSTVTNDVDNIEESTSDVDKNLPSCYLLLDSDILKSIVTIIGACPEYKNQLEIKTDMSQKKGLSLCLEFKCIKCEWRKCFYTSKEVKNDNRGASSYEVNYLSIIAMREIGRGHTSLSTLCGIMNLPPPMNIKAYNDMQEKIASVYKEVANQSMQNAANEFRFKQQHDRIVEMIDNNFENAIADITVSGDGSWQKRGFSSLNVLVTLSNINKIMQFLFFMGTEKKHRT